MQASVWGAVFSCIMLFGFSPASAFFSGLNRGTCVISEYRERLEIESALQSDDVTLSTVRIAPQRNRMAPEVETRFKAPISPRLVLNIRANKIVGGNVETEVTAATLTSPSFGYILSNPDQSSQNSYQFMNDWKHPFNAQSRSVFPFPPSYQSEEERVSRLEKITSSIKDGQSATIVFLIDNFTVAAAAFLFAPEDLQLAMQIAQSHSALISRHSSLDDCQGPPPFVKSEQQRQVDQAWDQQCKASLPRINAERVRAGIAQRDGRGQIDGAVCGQALQKFRTNQRRAHWLESQKMAPRSPGGVVSKADAEAYQTEFDTELRRRRYPSAVFASCVDGEPNFAAWFLPFPSQSFRFYSHHGLTDEAFATRAQDYSARGFELSWRNRLSCGGKNYNQAVWVKK